MFAGRERVLELGCGSGALTYAFARAMPPGWSIIATDYSEKLLAGAPKLGRWWKAFSLRPSVAKTEPKFG